MTDDEPLDLAAVAADDEAVERLRAGGSGNDDRALTLLHDLLGDVEADLPSETPVGCGSTVVAYAGEVETERRLARKSSVVVVVTAGLLSLGGVAAAGTLAPSGSALHDLGQAVRSAAGAVVGAVTPPETPRRAPAVLPTTATSPARAAQVPVAPPRPAPGATVAATARSLAAHRHVVQLLDAAEAMLDDGRAAAAVPRLDLAERRLAEVLPSHRGALPARLAALRERAQAPAAKPKPTKPTKPTRPARSEPAKPAPATRDQRKQQPPAPREAPDRKPDGARGEGRPERSAKGDGGHGRPLLGQLSDSDASAKPRA